MRKHLYTIGTLLASLLLSYGSHAQAALLSSVSYYQTVAASDAAGSYGTGGDGVSAQQTLVGTSLPVSTTVTATAPDCSATAQYNFSDNGTTAAFTVATQGTLHKRFEEIGEGTGDPTDLIFTLSQPAIYVISLTFPTTTGTAPNGGISAGIDPYDNSLFDISSVPSPLTYSGTLLAGVKYRFREAWDATATPVNFGTYTASDNFSLVITAIPEPASAGVVFVLGGGLLARRRSRV